MQAVGQRPERFNLSPGMFEDLTRRMRASSWRVMIHVLTVSFAGEMHAIVYPYHTGDCALDRIQNTHGYEKHTRFD